jgi:putative oxidoreductase
MGDDGGILLLRVVLGLLLAGHGIQKVSFRLGGKGLAGGIQEFASDGFRGGVYTALAAGLGQIGAGLFLILGLLTPLAALVAIGVMTVALTVKTKNGLWVQNDGYEYPLVLIVMASTLSLAGAGNWSIDALLGIDQLPLWTGLLASLAGILAGFTVRLVLHAKPSPITISKEN